jgi:transposase
MVICDRESLPVSVCVESASPHEVTLVERTLAGRLTKQAPVHLVADRAYDSDPHDKLVKERFNTELISPHRRGRVKPKTQDGRKLRRYKRRWKIERLNAWLQNYRRVATRYEHTLANFVGFVYLACILILLRHF